MKNHSLSRFVVAGLLGLVLLAPAAGAATLRYTFTGTGSGTLGADTFVDRAFAIVGEADPAGIADCDVANCRYVDFSSSFVRLQGLGDFSVSTTLRAFNTAGNVGLSRGGPAGSDLYNVFPVALNYDFSTAIGPVAALASLLQWHLTDVVTSGGVLAFDDSLTNGTFNAEGVPLPSAAWLFGSALVAGAVRRRRPL